VEANAGPLVRRSPPESGHTLYSKFDAFSFIMIARRLSMPEPNSIEGGNPFANINPCKSNVSIDEPGIPPLLSYSQYRSEKSESLSLAKSVWVKWLASMQVVGGGVDRMVG